MAQFLALPSVDDEVSVGYFAWPLCPAIAGGILLQAAFHEAIGTDNGIPVSSATALCGLTNCRCRVSALASGSNASGPVIPSRMAVRTDALDAED